MLTSYNSILTFNNIKLFGLCLIVLAFSCEDADYDLDNPYDEMINGKKPEPEKVESFPGEFELNMKIAKRKNKK